jgi:hypothetical protein
MTVGWVFIDVFSSNLRIDASDGARSAWVQERRPQRRRRFRAWPLYPTIVAEDDVGLTTGRAGEDGASATGTDPERSDDQVFSYVHASYPRTPLERSHIRSIITWPKPEHDTWVAPSIRRAKS